MTDLIEQVVERHMALVERAGLVDVVDADSADVAGRLLMEVRAVIEQIDAARFEITRPLDEAKRRAMEQADRAKAPYVEAKQQLDGAILGWNLRERARIEAERVAAEVRAQNAAAEGRMDDAVEAILEREALPQKVHRAAGTSVRETWSARIDDLDMFFAWVAKSPARVRLFMMVNQSALDTQARTAKGPSNIPGVTFHARPGLASTSKGSR